MANSVYVPGGAGGLQGMRCGKASEAAYDPLDSKGSQDGGDWARTRITGGLGHQIVSSLTSAAPKSYYTNSNKNSDA